MTKPKPMPDPPNLPTCACGDNPVVSAIGIKTGHHIRPCKACASDMRAGGVWGPVGENDTDAIEGYEQIIRAAARGLDGPREVRVVHEDDGWFVRVYNGGKLVLEAECWSEGDADLLAKMLRGGQ